jgi:hypothetical protein
MRVLLFLSISFLSLSLSAQEAYKAGHRFGITAAYAPAQFAGTLFWTHDHGFGKKEQRFRLGYGMRFTAFVAANPFYTTAPSKYTSPTQSIGTFFSETIEENIDTIAIQTGQTNALNAMIQLGYRFSDKWEIGFNIDAIGFSFGGSKTVNVISSSFDEGQSPVTTAKPTAFNLLLTSDNDIGSLNSELFIRYWPKANWGLQAGGQFNFSEYTTTTPLSFNDGAIENDRYRIKSLLFMAGFIWTPFNR